MIELTIDKILDLIMGDNHRTDETIEEETMVLEVTVEIEAEIRVNYRIDFSNDRNSSRDINRSRTRERSLTPRRNNRRYQSPNLNLGTRNRFTSRVTTNRDRIRYYKCREYDYFANECPNQLQMTQMAMSQTELHYI